MPNIVINEKDETLAGSSAASTDVVFVPGFAATNTNYIIYRVSGISPDAQTKGSPTDKPATTTRINSPLNDVTPGVETGEYPQYACNTVDQITWRCDSVTNGAYTWTCESQIFVKPCPENIPVLCETLSDFESYFGKKPYVFKEDQDISAYFQSGSTPLGSKYIYRAGDYERSYIYAKELIKLGLPVIYENIVDRGDQVLDYDKTFAYARENRSTSVSVTASEYETIYGGEVAIEKIFTCGEDKRFYDGSVDITPAFVITGTDPVPGDIVRVGAKETSYEAAYEFCAVPTLGVDEKALTEYMSRLAFNAGKYSYVNSFDLRFTSTGWVDNGTGEAVTIADYGFSLVGDAPTAAVGDSIQMIVTYTQTYDKEEPSVKYLYDNLADCYSNADKLSDKGEFTVKYITSGAYPTYELVENHDVVTSMINCAYNRGDAFALIDHTNNPERSLKSTSTSGSVYAHISKTADNGIAGSDDYNTFATMFTPWAAYGCTTAPSDGQTQIMPASFAYLTAMAVSIVTNPNWLAVAGVNRGLAPTIKALNTIDRLTNTIADAYQPRDARAVNAITNIKPYGLTIWGNRTLVSNADGNLKATSFLNVRAMVCDIKKVAYTAAKSLLFEQNTEILWNKFKSKLTPTLDKMVHGYGLSSYRIIKGRTKYNGDPLAKGEIAAVIKIYPVYSVEDFEITVVMSDEGVEVD